MSELLLIAVAAATVNNFVLARLLGLCPVLGSGSRPGDVAGVSFATTGALTVTAGLSHLLDQWVLVPYELPYLRVIAFLALTGVAVGAANLVSQRYRQQIPVITINCAVLGVALLTSGTSQTLGGALAMGFGAGIGFGLALLLFAGLGPRLEQAPVPAPLRGPAIAFITLGMMSLAVLGFSGLGS